MATTDRVEFIVVTAPFVYLLTFILIQGRQVSQTRYVEVDIVIEQ